MEKARQKRSVMQTKDKRLAFNCCHYQYIQLTCGINSGINFYTCSLSPVIRCLHEAGCWHPLWAPSPEGAQRSPASFGQRACAHGDSSACWEQCQLVTGYSLTLQAKCEPWARAETTESSKKQLRQDLPSAIPHPRLASGLPAQWGCFSSKRSIAGPKAFLIFALNSRSFCPTLPPFFFFKFGKNCPR